MKVLENYLCEGCGTEYSDRNLAKDCEKCHKQPVSIRLLAKLGKAVKIADTSNQGKAKSKAASTVAVTLREDTKPFDKTDRVFNKDPFS